MTNNPITTADILLRDFCSYDRAAEYAEKIARTAKMNCNGAMAHEYTEASRIIREKQTERVEYWFRRGIQHGLTR
jgi:hypothetical protein